MKRKRLNVMKVVALMSVAGVLSLGAAALSLKGASLVYEKQSKHHAMLEVPHKEFKEHKVAILDSYNDNQDVDDTHVSYTLDVQATAYWVDDPVDASGTGIAFDGTPAVPYKTIAVDPDVIPLQSQVHVPGIGWCRANDTGNAIKGHIIDLAMESRDAAFEWGRRDITITVVPPINSEDEDKG